DTASDENLLNTSPEYCLFRYSHKPLQSGHRIANTHTMTHSFAHLFCSFIFRLRALRPNRESGGSTMTSWISCIAVAIPTIIALVTCLSTTEGIHRPAWSDPRFAGYAILG
ncbi:hypothetical protein PENTCL1PPCAC_16802, partial [Pristionchus entomophagus]